MIASVGRAAAPVVLRFHMPASGGGGCARAFFQGVFYDPDSIRREMLWENIVPALQSPGYYDALTTLWGYDIRHRLEEIEVPTLIVWGRNDRVVPVPAAFSYKKRIGDERRAGDLRPLRARAPDRAAAALQPAWSRDFLKRGRRARLVSSDA